MQKIAVIGTGGSADKYLNTLGDEALCHFYNSRGEGQVHGQAVLPLQQLTDSHYDRIVIAIYDYADVLPLLTVSGQTPWYWFNGLTGELTLLEDIYQDKQHLFLSGNDVLTVVYDLRIAPPTFDFLVFMVRCKLEANRRGLSSLSVVICPGDKHGFRSNIDFFSVEEMNYRVMNLFLPIASMIDKNASFYLARSRQEARERFTAAAHQFPEQHNFLHPVGRHFYHEMFAFIEQGIEHQILDATDFDKRKISEWAASRGLDIARCICITLRECEAHQSRNSLLAEWKNVATQLVAQGHAVIVIRDTAKAMSALNWGSGIWECPEAALSVSLRLALYQQCRVNLTVSNGTQVLCYFSNSHYLCFGMVDESCTSNTLSHLAEIGFHYGRNKLVGAKEGQYLCWDAPLATHILAALSYYFDKGLL
ncbi:hypothetical protein [Alteromonas sp. RKMC-009]|uniref:hypothetical protein n=1 Tax=Alteromonas sp. RKMC-009 TaxID=2267264 RepID=UPI000E69A34B|nr:hypothetical protein [Alteromonas sp. RKMC-009]AYA63674.1 hypothetical protein DS731_06450 [Alteromonas sp. RKMC-009]